MARKIRKKNAAGDRPKRVVDGKTYKTRHVKNIAVPGNDETVGVRHFRR